MKSESDINLHKISLMNVHECYVQMEYSELLCNKTEDINALKKLAVIIDVARERGFDLPRIQGKNCTIKYFDAISECIYFVGQGELFKKWSTVGQYKNGSTFFVPDLPMRSTREEAQTDLDTFAQDKKWKLVMEEVSTEDILHQYDILCFQVRNACRNDTDRKRLKKEIEKFLKMAQKQGVAWNFIIAKFPHNLINLAKEKGIDIPNRSQPAHSQDAIPDLKKARKDKELLYEGVEVKNLPFQDGSAYMMPLSYLRPNQNNPRKNFNQETLDELIESVRQVGVIEPILVVKEERWYRIVAGERRYRAAKVAGLEKVPVIVRELTEEEEFEIMMVENLHRDDLDPIEEAMAYREAMRRGYTQQ